MRKIILLVLVLILLFPNVFAYYNEGNDYNLLQFSQATLVMNSTGNTYNIDSSFQMQHVGNITTNGVLTQSICHGFYCLYYPIQAGINAFDIAVTILVLTPAILFVWLRRHDEGEDQFIRTVLTGLFTFPLMTLLLFFADDLIGTRHSIFLTFYKVLVILFFLWIVNNFLRLWTEFVRYSRLKKDESA